MELPEASTINIRNLSVKCGHCQTYQTLSAFERREDWNVYVFECENDACDPAVTRTLIEVPEALDDFARRDPGWGGGARHAGSEAGHTSEEGPSSQEESREPGLPED